MLKKRHAQFARQAMIWAASVGLVLAIAMPFLGHWGALVVAEYQPIKMAAFENIGDTQKNAPLYLFGWVNSAGETTGIAIPSGLSLMLGMSPDHEVTGLNSVAPADRPPAQLTFQSYHLMIALGFLFILVFLVALYLHWRKRLENARWFLWVLIACIPLSIIAINMGWTAAEVGRQPWVVQGLMRTTDGVSPLVSAGQIWTTHRPLRADLPRALHRLVPHLHRDHQEGSRGHGRDARGREGRRRPDHPRDDRSRPRGRGEVTR